MITINNGNTGEPIIEAIKTAFSNNTPVKLTIEQDGKTIVIPAYMSEMSIPHEPPYSITITIISAGEPIETI